MKRIRTILVDDEQPARDRLRGLLALHEEIKIVGEAADGLEAERMIRDTRPDLVFLDIEMPGRSGMETVAALAPPRPHVVFCTAFDQYALDAFEQNAVDYLLKPVNRARLGHAVERVRVSIEAGGHFQGEVDAAAGVQARLLPQATAVISGLETSGACRPAAGVGGDYYDFLSLGAGRTGIAVGDVSGKGMYAGLLMASLQGRLQSLASVHDGSAQGLGDLAAELNRLVHSSTDPNRFATLFYGMYDQKDRTLRYFNAGHNPPLLVRCGGDEEGEPVRTLHGRGTPIGLVPGVEYATESIRLHSGEILLIYSDGVSETVDPSGSAFGTRRLGDAAARDRHLPASDLRDRLLAMVDAFRGDGPVEDDVTLVVVKVTE